MITVLDGPVGSELLARGVPTPLPLWSAWALRHRPEVVAGIHRDYAAAGATVHTANTFRTKRRQLGDDWEDLARAAVRLCREAIPAGQRVAGSIAPLEDCYEPWKSPPEPRAEHRELATVLADAGCDVLLCETFPHVREGWVAVEEAVRTGVETWASFTAGPDADLLSPADVREAARGAISRGARAVLVNCVPAPATLDYVRELAALRVPFGAYANAGHADDALGWAPHAEAPRRYASFALDWAAEGATLIGGCCGTGPAHVRAVVEALGSAPSTTRPPAPAGR
jgi:S-methylmethionine-dependent homocysteine/selenocysteine methylase